MEIAVVGLAFIIAGWFVQLFHAWKGKKDILPLFIAVYAAGVFLRVLDGYINGLANLALMNLISLIVAALVLIKIKTLK